MFCLSITSEILAKYGLLVMDVLNHMERTLLELVVSS